MQTVLAATSWSSKGEGVGAWIEIQFRYHYLVRVIEIVQHFCGCESNKDIEIEFSEGTVMEATLKERLGANNTDAAGYDVDRIEVQPAVYSHSVRITVLTVYASGNNGFNTIEVFAHDSQYCIMLHPTPNMNFLYS